MNEKIKDSQILYTQNTSNKIKLKRQKDTWHLMVIWVTLY